jgi:hypothetical protein
MRSTTTVLSLVAGTVLSLASPTAAFADDADLPLKRITLYRSGVGSFEREASVDGDRTVSLRFETGQVNDILKSLVLLDLDGGKVGAVSYASQAPLERRLAGFEVDLSGAPSIETLFRGLRGAKVNLSTADGPIVGTILNVENRKTVVPPSQGGNPAHFDEPYVTIVTDKGVRAVAISRVGTFEFADAKLAGELSKALAAIAEQRADRLKSVDLTFNGPAGKARRVVAAYVHEMPVWKASYRLVLTDGKEKKPLIQGWAVVENTTDSDWEKVSLSLASGRPVSFTMDLYQPIFGARPNVPVPVPGALAGRSFEDGTRFLAKAASGAGGAPASAPMRASAMVANQVVGEADRLAAKSDAFYDSRDESLAVKGTMGGLEMGSMASTSQAEGVEAGEQFLYTVSAPVSIQRQRSAMLPILSADIEARRVSIYNPSDGLKNPMRGVSMVNSSGLHLMPGPVAVFDAGVYAGDAQIPHTSRGASRLLAYALDLDVAARSETKDDQIVSKVVISNGRIVQTIVQKAQTTYFFDNRDAGRARTLLVEHPRRINWDLIEPKKPVETTASAHRFETEVEAGKPAEFKVVEQMTIGTEIGVTDIDPRTLLRYSTTGVASKAVVDAINKAAQMQGEINATRARIDALQRETQEINTDQSRVRENMGRIDRNSDLYNRYMKKLGEQETRVEKIVEEQESARETLRKQEQALNAYLGTLNIE